MSARFTKLEPVNLAEDESEGEREDSHVSLVMANHRRRRPELEQDKEKADEWSEEEEEEELWVCQLMEMGTCGGHCLLSLDRRVTDGC